MARLYALDDTLMSTSSEIRVGDKVYKVDDRQKTVKQVMKLVDKEMTSEAIDKALMLTLGEAAFKELDEQDLPFPAYQGLFELVMSAVTGADPESPRFHKKQPAK